jgi:hypothetical protein
MRKKTSAEMFAEHEQLRKQAHDKVDRMDRKQLRKFIKRNGPMKATQEIQEIHYGDE